jgi:hypothetical protein
MCAKSIHSLSSIGGSKYSSWLKQNQLQYNAVPLVICESYNLSIMHAIKTVHNLAVPMCSCSVGDVKEFLFWQKEEVKLQ